MVGRRGVRGLTCSVVSLKFLDGRTAQEGIHGDYILQNRHSIWMGEPKTWFKRWVRSQRVVWAREIVIVQVFEVGTGN